MKKEKSSSVLIWIIVVLIVVAASAAAGYFYFRPSRPTNQITDSSITTGENTAVSPTPEISKNFTDEYTQVPTDHLFVYRTGPEIVSILENGTGIVFLGFEECPWCQAYAPILNSVAAEAGLEKIYYFDILNDRQNNTEVYQQIVALLGDNLDYDEEGRPRVFVPDVTIVKNGVIIAHNNDTSMNTAAEHGTPEEFWTPNRVEALKTQLRTDIAPLQSSVCSENGSVCN